MSHAAGPTAAIDRFDIRWRVPEGHTPQDDARRRSLEAALVDGPLEDALQNALAEAGVRVGEELCVRAITLPEVLVNPGLSDAAALKTWSRAIETAVVRAVRAADDGGHRPDVVLFRSRSHAAVDLVVRCLLADTARAWAWRQLGLWPDSLPRVEGMGLPAEVREHVAWVLHEFPELIVPVLLRLAGLGGLGSVVAQLGTVGLTELARDAWRAAGGAEPQHPASPSRTLLGAPGTDPQTAPAAALVARSRLAPELRRAAHLAPTVLEDWARLVIVENDPAAVACRTDAAGLVAAVAIALQPEWSTRAVGRTRHDSDESTSASDGAAEAVTAPVSAQILPADAPHGEALPGQTAPVEAADGPAPRGGTRTLWGGLLFLLHLVGELGVPERLDPGGAPVDVRGALYWLGAELLGAAAGEAPDPADPALLAFCGLAPATPRELPREEPTPEVLGRVRREAAALMRQLARRMAPDSPDPDVSGVLARVCRHPAMIRRDPGWTDVMLDLREVDLDVRRAGLDLDLGHLPWLGSVVRFCYG